MIFRRVNLAVVLIGLISGFGVVHGQDNEKMLIGNWAGEITQQAGVSMNMDMRIRKLDGEMYTGTASVWGSPEGARATRWPTCHDAEVELEVIEGEGYFVWFSGSNCVGKGKLSLNENQLKGKATFKRVGVRVKIKLTKQE